MKKNKSKTKKSFSKNIKKIFYLIQQAGSLMLTPRSHIRHLGNSFDNLASHSHHAAIIAYCVARMENLSHESALKAVGIAVFHDLVEARTGDIDFIAKHYTDANEKKAVNDQFSGISFGKDLTKMIEEYEERKSLVAKCAKDADSLTQIYTEWLLMWQGNKLAKKWFDSDFNDRVPNLMTKSAKKLAYLMKDSNPHEWWWTQFMENDAAIDCKKLFGKR